MNVGDRSSFRRDLPSGWFRRQLLIEMVEAVAQHEALAPRDLNRRRLRAYAEGLLRAWNLHRRIHGGKGCLSLAAVARLAKRGKRSQDQSVASVEVVRIERGGRSEQG